jgi:XRE family transcriptional regulator, master regulator for biofilm formation
MIGSTVRRARRRARLSQAELARRARVAQPYLSRLEAGLQRNPSIAVLKRLAKALGAPMMRLLA